MKNFKLIFPIFIALLLVNSAFAQSRFFGKVTEVIDGRTLIVEPQPKVQIKIQLQYIEVPEAEQQLHKVVKDHLTNLILNKDVEFIPKNINDTAQPVGQILLNGVDVSQQMLRDGAAWYSAPEKDIQNQVESKVYQNNEMLAKNEKRGVWSITDLKPAWEFRAEQEEKKRQEELKKQEEEKTRFVIPADLTVGKRTRNQRQTTEERELANENVKIWADVSTLSFITNSSIISQYEKTNRGVQPVFGNDVPNQRKYVITPISNFDFVYKNEKHKLLGTFNYYYDDQKPNALSNYWMIVLFLKTDQPKFANTKTFSVYANGKKIDLLGVTRRMVDSPDGTVEVFSYGITNDSLRKLKNAKSIEVRAGKYSGKLNPAFLKKIDILIDKML